jgi:endonuclease YncB( thermonuclease family)
MGARVQRTVWEILAVPASLFLSIVVVLAVIIVIVWLQLRGPIVVVDGDTVRRGLTTYRLYGIDAPETRRAKCSEERALGLAASKRVQGLIASAQRSELMPKGGREKYGRTLAHLFADGHNVGDILLTEGLALPYFGKRKPDWCSTLRASAASP